MSEQVWEKTATQTAIRDASSAGSAPAVGVVGVYAEGVRLPGAVAVDRPLIIGRDESADIVVADSNVSRRHARIEPAAGGVRVVDLKSHNGTFVRSKRIEGDGVAIGVGETLRVGKVLLLVVGDVNAYRNYPPPPDPLLLGGPRTAQLRDQLRAMAELSPPLLIEGETGCGKEHAARVIHAYSRRSGELVAVNCAALPGELIESEFFGHARGSFSGSHQARQGLFREAHKGTLHLDEVGELPPSAQAKLLRVLEDSMVRPVGEDKPIAVDVRIVAATNRPLESMVQSGAFRADLFHRLASLRVTVPPLRERIEDIPLLSAHLLQNASIIVAASAMADLLDARWPGNVRELRNVLTAAVACAKARGSGRVQSEDLPPLESEAPLRESTGEQDGVLRAQLCTALRLREGNVSQVARDLGLRRAGLYDLFRRLEVDPKVYRKG